MKFFSMNLFRSFQYLFVTLLLCFGVEFQTYAQYYPIHATVQWPSPQSPYLSDYYSGSRDRLIVTLLNRDLQQPLLFAKLRVKLKSTGFLATTREEQIYPMLELNANVPTRLTNLDLAPYLQPQNLQSSGSLRNGQLPTGYTEFSVQVVDYYTGRQLSAWHTGRSYLDIKKPPLLHSPEKDAQIGVLDPLFLRFQWMPRHQGVSGTEYEFVLKELPDNGVAPQSAFLYGQEIYRIRTRSTSLNYTHLEPLLLPNRRYAWQVQALARDGVEEVGMFENGGFSEINWFYLNDNCQSPTGLKSIPRFAKVDLSWQKVMGTTGYVVECRPKTKLNTYEWSRTQVGGERLTLGGLKPGWAYEWRVGTLCTDVRPVFSPVYEFTLSSENEELLADCGKQPAGHDLSREPNLRVKAGDVITIGGDYPMTLTEVTSLGDGWYFGRGKTRLKSVVDASVALRFDRLRINVDNYQIDGQVEASYDEKKGKIANVDYIDDGGLDLKPATLRIREHPLDFTLPDIPVFTFNPVTGSLETTDVNGHAQRIQIELPTNESYESVFPLLVTDEKGQSYQVGRVEEPSSAQGAEPAHGEASAPLRLVSERVVRVGDFNTESLTSRHGYVRFERGEGKYAFDSGEEKWYQHSVKVDRFYKPFSKGYVAPWKLVPVGEQDVIEARYEGQKRIDLTKVLFVSEPHAAAIPAQLNESDQSWKIQLRSVSSGSCYDVFAVYEGEVIGKLRVASYEKQQHKVVLVPMNDAAIDKSGIEEELKLIYAPVGIEFRVEVDERLRKNSSWDLADKDGKLSLIGDSFWGIEKELKLTEEMRRLHDLYTGLEDAHDGAVIFLLDGSKGLTDTKGSLLGEMPRKSRFGYVFSQDGANIGHTIAHELGHGLFTLQHTFDKEYGGKKSQGATRNLMDYNFGKELAAFQWNVMSAPAIFTKMDKVEEGKIRLNENEYLGFTPDGRVIRTRPNNARIFSNGNSYTISEFIDANGHSYQWNEGTSSYTNQKGESFKVEDTNTTGKVAIWKNSEYPHCFVYYKFIKVENYTSKHFHEIQGKIEKDQQEWLLDLVDNYSPGCLEKIAVEKKQVKHKQQFAKECPSSATNIVELTLHGKVYRKGSDGMLAEVQDVLSDHAIQNGELGEGIDCIQRFTIDSIGVWQLQAFGINKDLAQGKNINLDLVSKNILDKTNALLRDNQVTDLSDIYQSETGTFADGGKIKIDGSYSKVISEGIELTTTLIKTSEIQASAYMTSSTAAIKAPGLVTGSIEVAAQKVTDITSLAVLSYDIVTDESVRSSLYQQFQSIKDRVGEDPEEFFTILGSVVLTVTTGNTEEEWEKAYKSKDNGERSHLTTRGVGNSIISAMSANFIIKDLPEVANKLGESLKKVKKFVDNPFDEAGKLLPNVRYKTGEFDYIGETDELGRLEQMYAADLQLTEREKRLRHNPKTPGKEAGDHAGHLIADRFGGSPELDNLISQLSSVNLSEYKVYENQWAEAIDSGSKIEITIKVLYNGNEIRPSGFKLDYFIDGQKMDVSIISNKK